MTSSRWRATAAIAVLALLPLTGCQTRAGTAAFVGGTRISDDQVRKVADEGLRVKSLQQTVGSDVGGYRRLILGRLVKHVILANAARKLGATATEGQVDQSVSAAVRSAGSRARLAAALAGEPYRLPASELRPYLRDVVLLTEMGKRVAPASSITDVEAKKFYDENGGAQSGQTYAQLKPQVIEVMQSQRAQEYVKRFVRTQKVTVSPRYGRFASAKLFDRNEATSIVGVNDTLVRDAGAAQG